LEEFTEDCLDTVYVFLQDVGKFRWIDFARWPDLGQGVI